VKRKTHHPEIKNTFSKAAVEFVFTRILVESQVPYPFSFIMDIRRPSSKTNFCGVLKGRKEGMAQDKKHVVDSILVNYYHL